jgi:hypothetical protein
MTSEDDIKGLVSLKFLRPCKALLHRVTGWLANKHLYSWSAPTGWMVKNGIIMVLCLVFCMVDLMDGRLHVLQHGFWLKAWMDGWMIECVDGYMVGG